MDELRGEKIDIVKYSENPEEYVANALSPSKVVEAIADPAEKICRVIVPDAQAEPGHWQGRTERPSGCQADRLKNRYQKLNQLPNCGQKRKLLKKQENEHENEEDSAADLYRLRIGER